MRVCEEALILVVVVSRAPRLQRVLHDDLLVCWVISLHHAAAVDVVKQLCEHDRGSAFGVVFGRMSDVAQVQAIAGCQ